jgi:sodium transport system permease protein
MNWTNTRLIFEREVRDQLRDRRTLFMIFVLPVLLYPLLGLSFFQMAQFVREHPTSVLVLGASELPDAPQLVAGGAFDSKLFDDARTARLLQVTVAGQDAPPADGGAPSLEHWTAQAQRDVREGRYDVVVVFPPAFSEHLKHASSLPLENSGAEGGPRVYHNSAAEKSRLGYRRVMDLLERWQMEVARENLRRVGVDPGLVRPFTTRAEDIADQQSRDAALWSKLFPFVLLIWALTGAFYPAIDLCAGEKERGTLETLLSSPATRDEIVWGKLFTVMAFSIMTVLLNLASMGISGMFILSQLPQFGPPPVRSLLWLLVAIVPVSALFSALCLALAAFARSTKEGQYYLMPLVLITMPLVVLPMAPGVDLTLGNSLIPVTGIVLLLRSVVEGDYVTAAQYAPVVVAVTLLCCLLAIRWAVDQFNAEGVLFRESERLDLGLWVKHLRRDREDVPTIAQAMLCGVLILVIRFFMSFVMTSPQNFGDFARLATVTQLVVIATPALLMTIMLTRSPRQTLLLFVPPWWGVPVAGMLAVLIHPVASALQRLVLQLYPVSSELAGELSKLISGEDDLWLSLLVLALVPAICEELAFRGFILSGLRRMGHKWRAIAVASVLFGLSHAVIQQSLIATLVGLVIGCIAVQTGSLLPAIIFHAVHNAIAVLSTRIDAAFLERFPGVARMGTLHEGSFAYDWTVVALCLWGALSVLYWMTRQPYKRTAEEALQEAIDHHTAQGLAG